jgi:hydroxymethylglutaryl-CoA lyase
MNNEIKIIECPRDAMQGLHDFIPTKVKANYINELLQVGYDTIDFGSFVSPKAIPQMRDTAEVLSLLNLEDTKTKLLAIVANARGANDASAFPEINYLGYPFSISETFQVRNTNATIAESLVRVDEILEICAKSKKDPVIYISMGFGNPYGDEWNAEIVFKYIDILYDRGVKIIALSDTIGVATPESISYLFSEITPCYEDVLIGAHLHTLPHKAEEKIKAAYDAGCRRIDCAIKGYGGCPMAKDDLTGNMPSEAVIDFIKKNNLETSINLDAFDKVYKMAAQVFPI